MVESQEEFARRKIEIAVVSFAEPQRLKRYQEHHRWPFVMLADPNRTIYRKLGLGRLTWKQLLSWRTLKLYFHLLRQGRKLQTAEADDIHQSGGDFLFEANSTVIFAHRSNNPADRPEIATLLNQADGQQ